MITIDEKEFKTLLRAKHTLNILEADGVDNWLWYMEGRTNYIAKALGITPEEVRKEEYTIDDVVEKDFERRVELNERSLRRMD